MSPSLRDFLILVGELEFGRNLFKVILFFLSCVSDSVVRSRPSPLPYLLDLLLLEQRILFPMQCAEAIDAILVLASDFDFLLLLLLRELPRC